MEKYKDAIKRSIAKTITYRTGSSLIMFALAVLFLEITPLAAFMFILKMTVAGAIFYIIHERLWCMSFYKKCGMNETRTRSLVKTISWRIYSVIVIAFLAWAFGVADSSHSVMYSLISNGILLIFHYIHERVWNKVQWGKLFVS